MPCLPKAGGKLGSGCLLTSPLSLFSRGSGPCCPAQPFKTEFSDTGKTPLPRGRLGGCAFSERSCFGPVEKSRQGWPAGQWGQEAVLEPCSWPVVSARWVQPLLTRPLPASRTKQLLLRLGAGAPCLQGGGEVASPPGFSELHPPKKLAKLPPFTHL